MKVRIARVFPRRTKATPDDDLVFFGPPPMFIPKIDEVHVSVAFTWDIPKAQNLAYQWEHIAPVKIGGPAFNQAGGDFVPGRYVKQGYTITSRGCPNRCWFCAVWRREPNLKELPIQDGWNVLDDNLLACSEYHIRSVFGMLKRQPQRSQFTGGFEAARLEKWHIPLLVDLKPQQMFFAYDEHKDLDPLKWASILLTQAGFNRQSMRCYVLIGYPGDTEELAECRLLKTIELGFFPMAMLWRDESGKRNIKWMRFQRQWARPAIIYRKLSCNEERDEVS